MLCKELIRPALMVRETFSFFAPRIEGVQHVVRPHRAFHPSPILWFRARRVFSSGCNIRHSLCTFPTFVFLPSLAPSAFTDFFATTTALTPLPPFPKNRRYSTQVSLLNVTSSSDHSVFNHPLTPDNRFCQPMFSSALQASTAGPSCKTQALLGRWVWTSLVH